MTIDYRYSTDEHIHYYTGKIFKHTASLTKKEFEWWLKKNHRLEYTVTCDGEEPRVWQMSLDEFLEASPQESINMAIESFLFER